MIKSTLREIKTSLARYLAILAIVALGVGFYSGLQMCKPDMLETANTYLRDHSLFDYQIISTYGIDDDSVKMALETDGVAVAEPSIEQDILMIGKNKVESAMKAISMPISINSLNLVSGRLPEKSGECVVDNGTMDSRFNQIGETIKVSDSNKKSDRKRFAVKEFEIVGFVNSPLYLDYERGSTSVGNGSLDSFFYIPEEDFDTDYYTQLYIKLDGDEYIFSNELDAKLTGAEDLMEDLAERITAARRAKEKDKAQDKLDDKKADYNDGVSEYNKGNKDYKKGLNKYKKNKAATEKQFAAAQKQIDDGQKQIDASKATLEEQLAQLEAAKEQGMPVDEQIAQVKAGLEQIAGQQAELDKSQAELNAGIAKAKKEFADAEKELKKADKELDSAKKELDDAKVKLDDAQHDIDTLEEGDSYQVSREDNIGYSTFEQNANIVSNIAKIFPLFFLLVAALVCMTTMTRMMEDQRSQIGVLKALGYGNGAVLAKYMFYSGSAATLGAVIGFFAGCRIFPAVIWNAYTMMYDFNANITHQFDPILGLECLAVALLCSMGATYVSCAADFGVAPAQLIRPKTPRAGKRILLERITPIWNRISFLYKVSLRNIFRYKKRFLMMVVGIAGCTALLIAGFGINTTIKGVARFQFDEVTLYDYQIIFNEDMGKAEQQDFKDYADDKLDDPGQALFLHSGTADFKVGSKSCEVTLNATDNPAIGEYFDMHYKGESVPYPGDGEVVICSKLQHQYNIKIGDEIKLTKEYNEMTAKVSGVFDNYVGEPVYMTAKTYEEGFGEKPEIKTAFVKYDSERSGEEAHEDAAVISKYEHTAVTVVNQDTLDRVDSMMESLNAVIYVVILCAGLLAFIVLYNLTNINITERIREIATIKVLGFKRNETSSYVFRENIFLTGFGALAGIPLGRWLLEFVIDNININMIYFVARITWQNYLYSVLLTFAFALIVNLAMQPVLRKISMTESLKSIE